MEEYVRVVCNFFNNLKGYMEKEEYVELLKIMNNSLGYKNEDTDIEKHLNRYWMQDFNESVENDENSILYKQLNNYLSSLGQVVLVEKLNYLVKEEYLWGYEIKDNELTIRYGLASVCDTERVIDIESKDLKKAFFESAEDIRVDIESSLVDANDFFGYDNAEQLEDRIVEETDYLKLLSSVV